MVHFSVTRAGRRVWNGFASANDKDAVAKVEKQAMSFAGDLLWSK